MANRDNPYEAAFEEYLRSRRIPYVAVDESKRSLLGDGTLKSLDFIVSPADGVSWLVDVKGRRFPTASGEGKQYWKNWSTRDDLRSLAAWKRLFGGGFQGLLVFAYDVLGDRAPLPAEQLFTHRGALYGFLAVRLEDYAFHARPISLAWDTVAMPTARFRQLAVPIETLFAETSAPAELVG
jgi:hypothetical protein